jgi:hypothetical protein
MELSDFTITTGLILLAYILGANNKQYQMAKDWSDSHPNCDISFYEDWIQNTKPSCKLNYINNYVGSLGRKFAYREHNKKIK